MEIVGKTNIDFLGLRRVAFIGSTLMVLLGLIASVQIARGQANLGIDFVGGTSVQVLFERPVDLGEVRRVLAAGGFADSELQQFVGGRRLFIRMKASGESVAGTGAKIKETLTQGFSDNPFILESSNEVGPVIGRELQVAALWAIVISLLGIVTYIAWRFEFRFGIAATVATFHDVLVVLGIFFLMGKEITLLIVTALLTLAGYSLTDTVVVFDRIRENFRARRRGSLAEIINASINEVLSRTIMTSLTTLLAIFAIFLLGGEVLRDFSLALLFGIVVGTYSSVFVASAIVYEWRVRGRRPGVRAKRQAQSLH
ncbi:MAG: protein translocase subunit SecF [candidate division NC10 bacterium]|nr:protein translocase subunit SecF [candidate division NC10 bacterium]